MLKQIKNEESLFTNGQRPSKRNTTEIYYEKQWKKNPEQFNPLQNALKRNHFHHLKAQFPPDLKGKLCLDLGSGHGKLSTHLEALGAEVTAVDIAKTALKHLESYPHIKKEQQFIPYTSLPDDFFDYIIASDIIAELPEEEYRLFFSEVARLVKPSGQIILTTPIDIHSEDALEKLLYLAETELNIETLRLSYHRLFIQLQNMIPWMDNWDLLISPLEKITKFFYDQEGVSYVIFKAVRRPLFIQEPPIEPKPKKSVWE